MASGAGALKIIIGGPATYDGIKHNKRYLGKGQRAQVKDITRAIALVEKALVIWLFISATLFLLSA